jgi:hypothetical protein
MNERPTDDPIEALRGPALTGELAREADDLTAMVLAFDTAPSEEVPRGIRRRGALVAAAAIACLGIGGLAVAGPGVFAPAADTPPAPVEQPSDVGEADVERHVTDPDVTCADGNHGQTVSTAAQADGDVTTAAHSQCGKPIQSGGEDADAGAGIERHTTDPDVTCADGNHGQTVSTVAQADGDVTAAAHSQCGKPIQSGGDHDAGDADDTQPGPDEHANERAHERAGQPGDDD